MGKRIGHAKMRYVALYMPIAFVLALAGMLVRQRRTAVTVGTLRTQGTSFVVLATATALILALLTFLPALSLGRSPTACSIAVRGLPQSSLPTGPADSATRFRIENPPNAPVPQEGTTAMMWRDPRSPAITVVIEKLPPRASALGAPGS